MLWWAFALGLLVVLGGPAVPAASADPAVERRVAALRALIAYGPVEGSPLGVATEPAEPACARSEWWRYAGYTPRGRIRRAVRDAALRHGVPARLIRAVIRHESNFQVDAVSHRGAQGLMQLMPATAEMLGVRCPFEPRQNIMAGSEYLRALYDRFGTWHTALLAYNAGPSRVAAGRVPEESRAYALRVLRTWRPMRYAGRPR